MVEQSYSLEFAIPLGVLMLSAFIWWKWQQRESVSQPPPSVPPPSIPTSEITLRVILPSAQSHTCTIPTSASIAQLKERVFPGAAESIILVYMGRRLQNDMTIQDCRLPTDAVLHAQRVTGQASQEVQENSNPFAFIFLGMVLAGMWILMVQYPSLFQGFSKVMLVAFTCLWGWVAKSWL